MGQFCCRLCSYFCPGGVGQQGQSQQSVPSQQAAPDFNQILAKPGLAKADLISIRDSIKQTVSTLKHGTGSSSSCGNNMSANANDLFQAAPGFLNAISEEADRAQGGLQLLDQTDDVMGLKILTEILKAFGALHWVACSLSLVAYLLKIKVCRNENKKEAMELLDEMVDLASELVGKYEHFSPDNETFKKAIGTIIDGAISCCDVIPGSLARFITADSDANLLINIRQKMKSIKMDIISQCEEEILNRIPKPYQSYEPGQASRKDSAISGDKRVEKIMALLSVGSSTSHPPRALIIRGIGGIGKTTLLDKVCSTLLDPHDGRSFKHVKISLPIEDPNPITHWQQVLYETLTTKAMKFADEKQGQFEILRELKKFSKPVLLSIDNASDESQLNMLLPEELDQIPSGSLILITTRNVGVKNKLKDKGIQEVKEYPVERLSAEDSRNILEKMIGEHILKKIDEKDFVSLLKGCDGHPLALTIAGKFIRYEVEDGVPLQEDAVSPQEACKYVLESFENHPEDEGDRIGGKELFKALDYSINHLPDDSKTAFFDIVVFFNMSDEFTWDEVKAIYDPIPFKRLKDRSLIQKKDNKVQVHDLLCSQARCQMAKCATRIKGWKELEPLLNHQQGIERVEGLDFGHKSDKLGQNLNENIFKAKLKQMTRLRLLLNSPPLQDMYPQEFLQAFSGYELNKFPFSNTDILRSLNIYASPKLDLINLFSPGFKFPTLRHLRLSECKTSSRALPEKGIAELKSLKTLQIKLCKKLTKLPQDLWSLTSLQKLDLSRCESLEAIPPIKGMGQSCRIQTILLSGCVQLKTLPEDLWSLTSLQHLNLLRCKSLKELPPFKGMAHSCCIQILDLLECTGLKTLPGDLWSLTSLQHLDLRDCQSLVALPPIKGMGQSCSIKTLNLSSCIKLKTLIEDLWSLTSLQHLNLTGCENLKALPLIKGMGKFCCIQKIRVSECTGLKTLPEDLWSLTSLQHLNLAGCESLEALPPIKGLTQSCCIQVLNLSKCIALKTLPEDLWSLTSLQKLDLSHCESLKSLPLIKGMGKSCCIQTIHLSGCRALETLPENLQSLTSLRELHLEDCSELVLNGTSQWASANIVVFKH